MREVHNKWRMTCHSSQSTQFQCFFRVFEWPTQKSVSISQTNPWIIIEVEKVHITVVIMQYCMSLTACMVSEVHGRGLVALSYEI